MPHRLAIRRALRASVLASLVLLASCGRPSLTTDAPRISYPASGVTCVTGVAVSLAPTNEGGAAAWSVSPDLPRDLVLDPSTGIISGIPTVVAAAVRYAITARNAGGVSTFALDLAVDPAPPVVSGPADAAAYLGMTATLAVTASSPVPLGYQWYVTNGYSGQHDSPLVGEVRASLTTSTLGRYDSGATYRVAVSDGYGNTVSSRTATLTVKDWTRFTELTGSGTALKPRRFHTATRLLDGRVLLAGGDNGGPPLPNPAELYDPVTRTISTTGALGTARFGHTATLLADGTVLVTGGFDGSTCRSSAEIFDPADGTFTPTAGNMIVARERHTATRLASGKVLLVGGNNGTSVIGSAELYDPVSRTFSLLTAQLTTARGSHTATLLPDGRVLVAGGSSAVGWFPPSSGLLNTAELFDPAAAGGAGAFTGPVTLVTARSNHVAVLLPSGTVLVAGGYGALTGAELFDPSAPGGGAFVGTGSLNDGRIAPAAALLADGEVLVVGSVGTSAERFSRSSFTRVPMPTVHDYSYDSPQAVPLPDGRVLVAGRFTTAELFE